MARTVFVPQSAMPRDWFTAWRYLSRLAFADRMVPAQMPEPALTPIDLWRQARIDYLRARDRKDTRGMGQARRKMRPHAHAQLAEVFGRPSFHQSPCAPSA